MIKTNPIIAAVHVDPLSITAGIQVLSGQAVQTFNRDTQEFVPDRFLVPLIILPYVNAIDPEKTQTGAQVLTGVEYYEGVPAGDGANRITDGEDYEIGDGTVEGFPLYALKVKKNIDPNTPVELFVIAIFTDKRTNKEVRVERSIKLYTALYDSQNYSVKITNQPKAWTIDPLRVVPDAEGNWLYRVTAQLYSGKEPVADEHAAYWWEIRENNEWREVTDDDIEVWLDCKDAEGHFKKELSFDARMIDGETAFRVRAAYFDTDRPAVPTSEELQAVTAVKVEMPQSLYAEITQTKGIKLSAKMNETVGFECAMFDNRGMITGKDDFFKISWIAQSSKAGESEILLGEGKTVEFVPASLKFDPAFDIKVYAQIALYSGHALVQDGDSAVVQDGAFVITKTYK